MFLTSKRNIAIALHSKPDADAIGACLVLRAVLNNSNCRKYNIYIVDDFEDTEKSVWDKSIISMVGKPLTCKTDDLPDDCHLYILDHSDQYYSLVKNGFNPKFTERTIIDHHFAGFLDEEDYKFGHIFRDPKTYATCEMMFDHLQDNHYSITPEMAFYLYMGMKHDMFAFRNGFHVDRIRKLNDLLFRYKASDFMNNQRIRDFDGIPNVSYIQERAAIGLVYHSSKDMKIQTIFMKISHKEYQKGLQGRFNALANLEERLLNTKGTKALIISIEIFPKKGIVKFRSGSYELTKKLREKKIRMFARFGFSSVNLNEEEKNELVTLLRKEIKCIQTEKPDIFTSLESS